MDKVYTTRQASELLGVSLRTIQLWVESGVLNAWKTAGGHRRIAEESVQSLLTEKHRSLGKGSVDAPFKLLVVEDEPFTLKLYKYNIDRWNLPLEVVTANDGFDGLIRLGQVRPNVLITDLHMPNMDGLEMIRRLRTDPEYDGMTIIAVTALDESEIKAEGGLADDVSVYSKPIPFDKLESIVRERFNQWHRRSENGA